MPQEQFVWDKSDKVAASVFILSFPALNKWPRKCPNEEYRWESRYVSGGGLATTSRREKGSICGWPGEKTFPANDGATSMADWSLTNPSSSTGACVQMRQSVNEASRWALFYYSIYTWLRRLKAQYDNRPTSERWWTGPSQQQILIPKRQFGTFDLPLHRGRFKR